MPGLECSGTISAHYNLCLLGSSDFWLIFVFLVETEFHHLGQASLELLTSGDPPASTPQSAGITGMSHRALPLSLFRSTNICFIYLGALLLGTHILVIVISSCYVDLFIT